MLTVLNPYQLIVAVLLLAWLIPLTIIWLRFEKLPHANQMLFGVLIWPCLLMDEFLRAFGLSHSWIFMAGVFQFIAPIIVALIYLSLRQLLIDRPFNNSVMFYLPSVLVLISQIPFLVLTVEPKHELLMQPPVGDLIRNWMFLAPYMVSGFILLIMATRIVELVLQYHNHLSDQVVDIDYYQFKGANGVFYGLIVVALIVITLTTLAMFEAISVPFWQSINNLCIATIFLFCFIVMISNRRYSPSPIDPNKLDKHKYSDEFLRYTLKKAEQTIISRKAYKHIGLRISQLANVAEVEPQALAIATRTILKRNFRAFIYHYRLEYAKKILMRTDTKVSTVAKRLGFNSEKFLSGMFIKYIQVMGKEQSVKEEDDLF
jgi:AraC-like DNA-binding protein